MTASDQLAHPAVIQDVTSPAVVTAGEGAPRRKALRVAGGVLTAVLTVTLVVLALAAVVVPRVIGAVPLTVLSGSMEPALSAGDLVVTRAVDAADVEVGDVITFQPESGNATLVTHRVIGVTLGSDDVATGFLTQGDANTAVDDPVAAEQVKGKVLYSIPLVGYVTNAGWGPQVIGLAAVGLIGFGLVSVFTPEKSDKESDGESDREEVQHA